MYFYAELMLLTVHFLNRAGKGREGKDHRRLGRAGSRASSLTLCLSFPAGLAFRNSQKGRGPQDCIPVFAGEPAGYAEFLAVTRSWKRSNLPGWKGKELECCLGHGSCPPDKHTTQPPSPGEVRFFFGFKRMSDKESQQETGKVDGHV